MRSRVNLFLLCGEFGESTCFYKSPRSDSLKAWTRSISQRMISSRKKLFSIVSFIYSNATTRVSSHPYIDAAYRSPKCIRNAWEWNRGKHPKTCLVCPQLHYHRACGEREKCTGALKKESKIRSKVSTTTTERSKRNLKKKLCQHGVGSYIARQLYGITTASLNRCRLIAKPASFEECSYLLAPAK